MIALLAQLDGRAREEFHHAFVELYEDYRKGDRVCAPRRYLLDAREAALSDEAVELLQELIRVDTSNPPGNETAAAELLRAYLEDAGVECELYAKVPERANLVARLRGRAAGRRSRCSRTPTSCRPTPREWTVDPFGGELRDGSSGAAARST